MHNQQIEVEIHLPTSTEVTPSPTLSTIPAPSCPRIAGKAPSGSRSPKKKKKSKYLQLETKWMESLYYEPSPLRV